VLGVDPGLGQLEGGGVAFEALHVLVDGIERLRGAENTARASL
jgi:hypothetical protein